MFDWLNQERRERLNRRLSKLYEQYDLETREEEKLRLEPHIKNTEEALRQLDSAEPRRFNKKYWLGASLVLVLLITLGAVWFWLQSNKLPASVETLLNQGEYQQAQNLCKKQKPSPATQQCLQITGFFLNEKPLESFEAEIHNSDSIYALVMQAEVASAHQDFSTAKALYEQVLKTKPEISQAYYGLGQVYQFQNQPLEALTWYQQAIAHAPKNRRFLINLASLQAELNQLNEAANTYRQVLAVDNSAMLAYIELIQVYQRQNNASAARTLAQQALQLFEQYQNRWQQQELNQVPWEIRQDGKAHVLSSWENKTRYFRHVSEQARASN